MRHAIFVVADASLVTPNGPVTLRDSPLKLGFDFDDRNRLHQLQAIELTEPVSATAIFVNDGDEQRIEGVGGIAHNAEQAELRWNELKRHRHLSRVAAQQFDEDLKINPFTSLGVPLCFVPLTGPAQEGVTTMFWTPNHGYLNIVVRKTDGSEFTLIFSESDKARLVGSGENESEPCWGHFKLSNLA